MTVFCAFDPTYHHSRKSGSELNINSAGKIENKAPKFERGGDGVGDGGSDGILFCFLLPVELNTIRESYFL